MVSTAFDGKIDAFELCSLHEKYSDDLSLNSANQCIDASVDLLNTNKNQSFSH